MTEFDRRMVALIPALSMLISSTARAAGSPTTRPSTSSSDSVVSLSSRADQIAMLVYPKMTALDLVGPQYMFSALMGAKVHLVGKTMEPVTCDTGITILPTTTFSGCPKDLTVFFTPGGTIGTLEALKDEETLAFVADRGGRADHVTSVCTGSLILGAAGLLKGYRATSHWAARDRLVRFGAVPVPERVVRDRNRITGAGVTAGLDFGLAMLAELRDETYAEAVQLLCEYDPNPPWHAGSERSAPPAVVKFVRQLLSPFIDRLAST